VMYVLCVCLDPCVYCDTQITVPAL
jgi:hypothetical protein